MEQIDPARIYWGVRQGRLITSRPIISTFADYLGNRRFNPHTQRIRISLPVSAHKRHAISLSHLSHLELFLTTCILLLAYTVRGITGFGSGLLAIPLLVFILPLKIAVPFIIVLDYLASLGHGVGHRQHIQWRDIGMLLPFSALGVVVALYLYKTADTAVLTMAMGGFITLYALYSFSGIAPHRRHSRGWAIPAGVLGGLIGTLFGTGGPFYVIYFKLRLTDKTVFRPTFAATYLFEGMLRILGLLLAGIYTPVILQLIIAAIPAMMLAMFAGERLHRTISPRYFQHAISLLLLCSGITLLLK